MALSPSFHRRMRWILGLGALVGLLAYGAYWLDQSWPYQHFRTVKKDVFYRSAQLEEDEFVECIEDYGIKTVINLRTPAERTRGSGTWYQEERRAIERTGIRHVDVPLPEGQPPSPEQVQRLLQVLDDPANLPVLIHCEKGTIRSAAVEGLFRREYLHETGLDAFARIETWGRDLDEDYPVIANFIKRYVARPRTER